MSSEIKNLNLTYRRLKISDYPNFKKLFYLCFNRSVSLDFFKWRYFNNKFSFCYGAFSGTKLIANVGMVSLNLNNNTHERIFSRHSSMVLKKYRGYKIFSNLLNQVKKKISKKVKIVTMWPNKNNHSIFGINKKNIISKRYYIYKTIFNKTNIKKTKNYEIRNLKKLKEYIKCKNSFFYKDYFYFNKRYLSYRKNEYLINRFTFKNLNSFFIIKINKDISGLNYVILDHFGSKKIKSKHFSYLVENHGKLIFLSKKKINNSRFKLLNFLNFKIGFINKFMAYQKKNIFFKKEIYLGDTDVFITI